MIIITLLLLLPVFILNYFEVKLMREEHFEKARSFKIIRSIFVIICLMQLSVAGIALRVNSHLVDKKISLYKENIIWYNLGYINKEQYEETNNKMVKELFHYVALNEITYIQDTILDNKIEKFIKMKKLVDLKSNME